jgi:hypothetical protein
MSLIQVPDLTVANVDEAAAIARSTETTVTIVIVSTRQVASVLPSGRVTVQEPTTKGSV